MYAVVPVKLVPFTEPVRAGGLLPASIRELLTFTVSGAGRMVIVAVAEAAV